MKRVSALWQASPRKVVGALFILMLAAMMAVASGASFTSTTPNVGNVVTAGIMKIDTDKSGGAILSISGLVPGHNDHGTVTLNNTGDAAGVLTLSKSNVSNSGPALSSKLDLVITDTSDGSTVYSGKLGNMARQRRPARSPRAGTKTYDFKVSFPDGGLPAGPTSGDNAYQSASTSVDSPGTLSASNDPVVRDHRFTSPRAGHFGRPRAHVRSAPGDPGRDGHHVRPGALRLPALRAGRPFDGAERSTAARWSSTRS